MWINLIISANNKTVLPIFMIDIDDIDKKLLSDTDTKSLNHEP